MEKRGQFYLIAAILIVVSLIGIAGISTYSIAKSEPKTIKDLSSDLKEESPRIIDYGIYNDVNLISLMSNFTEKDFVSYFLKKTDYANVTFIYGNKDELYGVSYYKKGIGSVSAGDASWEFTSNDIKKYRIQVLPTDTETKIDLLGKEFSFKLRDNEMFYFVIVKEKDGEVYVEKNE